MVDGTSPEAEVRKAVQPVLPKNCSGSGNGEESHGSRIEMSYGAPGPRNRET